MKTFLYHFFHAETSDRSEKGLVNVPKNPEEWPTSWKRIDYKQYPLFEKIILPAENGLLFNQVLVKRRSSQQYMLNNTITLSALAYILRCGYGLRDQGNEEENRTVPSAGQRYPLEVYVFLFKQLDTCRPGIYHYDVRHHALEPVMLRQFTRREVLSLSPDQEWIQGASVMVCITSVFLRMTDKYGSRGYRYILLEAGHAGQNMILAGTEKAVNIIPVGGVEDLVVERFLGLTNGQEQVVYSLFL